MASYGESFTYFTLLYFTLLTLPYLILPYFTLLTFYLFAILYYSVSAPPVNIIPLQDVHQLLMSAGIITCSDLGTFSSVKFCNTPGWQLLLLQVVQLYKQELN
jgi:hypothetical protein